MGRWDAMAERINATVQAEVPEPCVAIGALQPSGTYGAFGLGQLSGALGSARQHRAHQAAGGLSGRHGMKANRVTYIALSADRLYAFDASPTRSTIKVRGLLATWDRADVTVRLEPGRAATKVVFDHADGGHYELEASTLSKHNDPLLAELATMGPRSG